MPSMPMWMDLEMIILRRISERKRELTIDITHMWNLKNEMKELIYKTEACSQT